MTTENNENFDMTYRLFHGVDVTPPDQGWLERAEMTEAGWIRERGEGLIGLADFIEKAQGLADSPAEVVIEAYDDHVEVMFSPQVAEKLSDADETELAEWCGNYGYHRCWAVGHGPNAEQGTDFYDDREWCALEPGSRTLGEALADVTITPSRFPGVVLRISPDSPPKWRAQRPYGGTIGLYDYEHDAARAAKEVWDAAHPMHTAWPAPVLPVSAG